jgi:hypothetical protein
VRLVDFYQSVGRSGTIAGILSGSGNLTVTAPAGAQTLTLRGSSTGFTGDLVIDTNAIVSASTGVAGGTGTLGNYDISLNGGFLRVTPATGSNPLPGQTAGLAGQYYNQGVGVHNNNTGGVDYTIPTAARIDDDLNFRFLSAPNNLGSAEGMPLGVGTVGGNVEQWAAQWTGLINVTTGGDYIFSSSSDDASVVIIDGVQVVSNQGGHDFPGGGARGTAVNLTPGQHSITVRLTQGTGGAVLCWRTRGRISRFPCRIHFRRTAIISKLSFPREC